MKGVVNLNNKIAAEYGRLKALFSNIDEDKAALVDELLKKAAFLKYELEGLEVNIKKYGSVERSNKGNVRESVYYKTYLSTVNTYQSLIRTLNSIMGKSVIDDDDDFDEFMRRAGNGT